MWGLYSVHFFPSHAIGKIALSVGVLFPSRQIFPRFFSRKISVAFIRELTVRPISGFTFSLSVPYLSNEASP